MGFCLSKSEGAPNDVDKQLEEAALKDKLNFKVLLLGSGESGKSTVLKGLKLVNRIGLTKEEIKDFVNGLRSNTVQSMQILLENAASFGYELDSEELKASAKAIESMSGAGLGDFTIETARSVEALWQCSAIKQTFARRKEFWILEAAAFYLDNAMRFAEEDYEPTEEDMILARTMTTGIITTDIPQPPLMFQVVDVGGQRTERRKWIHCFDNVSVIIYVVNLAGYNTVLFEDHSQVRMKECLSLFKTTINSAVFVNTPVFLVFNKKDLFEEKIREEPINSFELFSEFEGGSDVMDSLKFIESRFREQITTGDASRVKVHFIAARFKKDVKLLWEDVTAFVKDSRKKSITDATKALGKA